MRLAIAGTALLAAAAFAAAGCASHKSTGSSSSSSSAPATAYKPLTISTDLSRKPVIPPTQGLPPEKLVVKDVVPGKGKAAKTGDTAQVRYVGVAYSTDKEFDSNWAPGTKLFGAQLTGSAAIIKGWVQGIPGMREGGRRLLVVPPDLAYGAQGSPPAIAPDETLVFVIDLKKVG